MIIAKTKDSLEIIKELTNEILPDSTVFLFGSRANGNFLPESDYDFMIVTKKFLNVTEKRSYKALLRKKLAQNRIPADILIEDEKEFQVKKNIIGHIVREVDRYGCII